MRPSIRNGKVVAREPAYRICDNAVMIPRVTTYHAGEPLRVLVRQE